MSYYGPGYSPRAKQKAEALRRKVERKMQTPPPNHRAAGAFFAFAGACAAWAASDLLSGPTSWWHVPLGIVMLLLVGVNVITVRQSVANAERQTEAEVRREKYGSDVLLDLVAKGRVKIEYVKPSDPLEEVARVSEVAVDLPPEYGFHEEQGPPPPPAPPKQMRERKWM